MSKNTIKLDKIDYKLLFELDKNSKIPITTLAHKLRISREIAKYRIKKLSDEGVIKSFVTMVNPAKLGYLIYKIYIKFQNLSKETETEMDTFLMKHKKVFWMAKCDGNFDIIIGVYVNNVVEFNEFLLEFMGKYNQNILARHISNSVYVDIYRKNYLTEKESQVAFWGGIPEKKLNDKVEILKLIAQKSRISIVDICKKTNLSSKTVISKIKSMEKSGIILGYRIILDLKKINIENFKAFIYFQNITKEKENSFKEFCSQNSNICYYIKTIAEWDAELDIEIENFERFNTLLKEIRHKFGGIIRNIDSVFISEETKGELNIVQNL